MQKQQAYVIHRLKFHWVHLSDLTKLLSGYGLISDHHKLLSAILIMYLIRHKA